MTERDPIERRLMLARSAAWAPEAAKARVRASLAAGGAPSAARVVRAAGVTKLTTAILVGAGFVAGYWLGVQRSAEPRERATAEAPSNIASGDGAPGDSAPGDTATAVRADPNTLRAAQAASSVHASEPAHAVSAPGDTSAPGEMSAPGDTSASGDTSATAHVSSRPAGDSAREAVARRAPAARAPRARERATPGRALLARAPAASADPIAEELALLSRAERAIRASEPALALSFLAELEARFPISTLLEERAAARLLAECALSNPGARRRAELFLNDRAASVYTDRVRRSCALEAPAAINLPPASAAADGSSRSGH